MLFAEGRNAVQVQRWLGHSSPAFTLSVYVHLLDGDLGEPLTLPACARGGNGLVTDTTPSHDTRPSDIGADSASQSQVLDSATLSDTPGEHF